MGLGFIDLINRLQDALIHRVHRKPFFVKKYKNTLAPPWSWIAVQIVKLMDTYPTGFTLTIAIAELELAWESQCLKIATASYDRIEDLYRQESARTSLFFNARITKLKFMHESLLTLNDDGDREMDLYLPLKCNPWINNTISSHMMDFSKNRRIRFICTSSINSLPSKRYFDESLSRMDRVLCSPPAQDFVWELQASDGPWIKDVFRDTFATVIQPHSMAPTTAKQYRLWVKVIHVEQLCRENDVDDSEDVAHVMSRPSLGSNCGLERQQEKFKRVDVYIVDKTDNTEPAILSFYDHQTKLTRVLRRGDYLGLYNPVVAYQLSESQLSQTDMVLEYGPDTVLCVMSSKDAIAAGVTKIEPTTSVESSSVNTGPSPSTAAAAAADNDNDGDNDLDYILQTTDKDVQRYPIAERDDEGLMDCSAYIHRLMIKDLEYSMQHVTLFGRVIAKANNNTFFRDGQKMDRYAMRIEDETGKVDVTLWGESGQYAKSIMVGHRVLLTDLSTSTKHKTASGRTTWYVNGSSLCGTTIYNLSTMECLLVSRSLRSFMPLYLIEGEGQWETQAVIVGWELHTLDLFQPVLYSNDKSYGRDSNNSNDFCISDYITVEAHKDCSEMIQDSCQPNRCNFCDTTFPEDRKTYGYRLRKQQTVQEKSFKVSRDEDKVGWIEWRLDDGQGILYSHGGEDTILNCRAPEFRLLSHEAQVQLLDGAVGKEWFISLSCVGTRGYHLDSLIPMKLTPADCGDLIEELTSPSITESPDDISPAPLTLDS